MIEIIPPLQKALQLIAVQLHAQHPGAGRRHGHEGIGHLPELPHAIVRPKPRNAGLQEGFQMVERHNGLFQCAGLIKGKVGKSVDHRPSLQVRLDQRARVAVAFQMIQRRLVGNVKIGAFRNAQLVQLLHQRGKKLAQEMGVCFAVRVRFPAEQPLFLAVHRGDDLRRGCRAPLRKQMGHFQIGDPAAAADLHPAFQPVKAEGIRALADVNVHQLNGQPFPSGRGIQRRRKQGRENHGATPAHSRSDKVFNDRPMLLTENGNAVVFRQTVRMEPVGSNQFLRRKPSRKDRHGNAGRSQNRFVVCRHKTQLHGIDARFAFVFRLHVNPEGLPLLRLHPQNGQRILRLLVAQKIGIESGGFAQIVIVRPGQRSQPNGNRKHRADPHLFFQRRFRAQNHRTAVVFRCAAEGGLKGNGFILKALELTARPFLPDRLVRKDLDGRRQWEKGQLRHGVVPPLDAVFTTAIERSDSFPAIWLPCL